MTDFPFQPHLGENIQLGCDKNPSPALDVLSKQSNTLGHVDYFILFYDFVDDYLERRAEFRGLHLAHATASSERGELRYAGAYSDPADGAALLFRCDDESTVRAFAEADPYVLNGLVRSWHIRRWSVVVGADYGGPVPTG